MQEEKESKTEVITPVQGGRFRRLRFLRYLIYFSYLISVILLFSVLTAIVANRKTQPFYSWIEKTRMEKYGHFVAGLIIEQKVNMQVDAHNDPLTEDEKILLVERLNTIDESCCASLNEAGLEPRDHRFLLTYQDLTPYIQGNYLILTDCPESEIKHFGTVLDKLYTDFIREMKGAQFEPGLDSRPHICFFRNRASYLKATSKKSKGFHDSLGFFSPVKNCIYFFSRKHSLEGLEGEQKYNETINQAKKNYRGNQLRNYLRAIEKKKQEYFVKLDRETLCTLRHEGAHQLAHIYGLHSTRGFEKLWLTEGIAQYFETDIPGEPREQKKKMIMTYMEAGDLFPWDELVNSDETTFSSGKHKSRQLAYSQSWFLVRYLLQHHKKAFFKFVQTKKTTTIMDDPLTDFELLCQLLNLSKEQLLQTLQEEILKL